jgi:hypothetical protein
MSQCVSRYVSARSGCNTTHNINLPVALSNILLQLQSAIAHLERLILKSKVKRVDGTSSPPTAAADNVSPAEQSFFKAAKTVRSNSASSLEHSTHAAAAVAAASKFARLNDIDGATTATRRSSASSTASSSFGGTALYGRSSSIDASSAATTASAGSSSSRTAATAAALPAEALSVDISSTDELDEGGAKTDFEISFELENVHAQLQEFLQKKRRQRGSLRNSALDLYEQSELLNGQLDKVSEQYATRKRHKVIHLMLRQLASV